MKTKIYLVSSIAIITLIVSFCGSFLPNNDPIVIKKGNNYDPEWKKVEGFEQKGLPKSALEIVDEIYASAKKDTNSNQIIKSFIYKMKYKNATEESAFENSIYDLQNEISNASYPAKNIMNSMLAEMYWMYYQSNRWKFNNRTQTVGFDNKDIKTWALNTLADKVIKYYKLSLESADSLKRTDIKYFDVLITKGENTDNLRPTLYDFLAQRAVIFFQNKEIALSKPADNFQLIEDFYFANASDFANSKIKSTDTLSLQFYGIQILQDLTKFRLQEKNVEAFIDVELQRLKFVYANSVNPKKENLYETALTALLNQHKNIPISSNISYELGLFYKNAGIKYQSTDSLSYKYKNNKVTAYNIFHEAVIKYPTTNGSIKCENEINQLEQKSISFTTEQVIIPNQKFVSLVSYANVETLYTKVLKIDLGSYKKLKTDHYGENLYKELISIGKEISKNTFTLPIDKDYNTHSTEILFNELDLGFYLVIVSDNPEFTFKEKLLSFSTLTVSNISYFNIESKNKTEFYVLNRKTGESLNNVKADILTQEYSYSERKYIRKLVETLYSNEKGYFKVTGKTNSNREVFFIEFSKEKDFLSSNNSFYIDDYNPKQSSSITNTIFTDRAIYRPGQTVYFKGISILNNGEKHDIQPQYAVAAIFFDVNYQKISTLKLVTNEFGTFNGSFQIPTGVLNGRMQIKTPNGTANIRVEEYKRPKFETEILPFKGNYRLNDVVEVQGKATAFSGANITEASVKYRIVRAPISRYWWWDRYSPTVEIENGTVKSNEEGVYTIKFKAIPDLEYKKSDRVDFNYTIYVDVTDLNGETQSTTKNIKIGYVDLNLSANIPASLQRESTDTFKISTTNLNGENIKANGDIKIYKLEEPKEVLQTRLWSKPDKFLYTEKQWNEDFAGNEYADQNVMSYKIEKEIYSLDFDTDKSKMLLLSDLNEWETGHYKLVMNSTDAYGSKIDNEQYFSLFSENSKKMPYPEIFWKKPIKVFCEPGEKAKILIGSSKSIKVLYEIMVKNDVVKSEIVEINNEQKIFEIPIIEDYRGNISVSYNFIYNNRAYSYSQTIIVPFTNKQLDIEFQTFRNKLLPGEKEKWLMTIKDKKGDAALAEMMATLYDKSLDQFATNNWYLNVWNSNYNSRNWRAGVFGTSNSTLIYNRERNNYKYAVEFFDEFNWFGFNYYSSNRYAGNIRMSMQKSKSSKGDMPVSTMDIADAEMEESANDGLLLDEKSAEPALAPSGDTRLAETKTGDKTMQREDKDESGESIENGLTQIKARTNFNETAFFYPELRTNEKGELVVEFTVPESLTTWKMMGLATSKDLKIGYVENELITQKTLMVMPNPPRFFREGDKMEFPLKISNVSDKELTVDYNIEFFDAITNKTLKILDSKSNVSITIPAGGNKSAIASITIPENVDAIKYRVVAKSGQFSDAEENVVPVLNNRMLVTESLPLPIRGNQTKTFTFEKLKNNTSTTLKNYKYTLEFTSNPAWYAIQALPYLMEYPYECAEQTFSRFYANSLATHIANSSPKIKAVFDSWKNTPKSEALLSNLEKNQELKALMLEETPWVLDGKDESERKQRIGLLFDLNKMSQELEVALKKLKDMQASNGGWPWFKGMPDNRYITQHIVSGLGHLDHLHVKSVREDNSTYKMITNAISYLDNRISEDYRDLKKYYNKKQMEEAHIGSLQIQYLYARSFFTEVTIDKSNKEAYDYYFNQAKKYWLNQSKYSQGMIALALNRENKDKTGIHVEQEIVNSLKENSTSHEELGMYWKDNTAGYYWYEAPIEMQALMIEVFDEVANDKNAVEDLKVWLLKQKQTQNWKTTKATSEAVYALLLKGTDLLASDKLVEISIGNKIIDPKKIDGVNIEAGTGYFKTSWNGSEITSDMGEITVSKKDDGVAWGAVYWQYFEQLDKITKHKTPLYLEKKLFVEKITKSGKVIEPIEKNQIKVGDKIIVRIELRVDRDMEYIHMKDMRASGFEPMNVISRYKYQDGLGYYETTKDASTNFFMDRLRKGTYVFEYPVRVTHKGDFSNGITTIQCMYAPEFTSHSEGVRVLVE